MNHNSDPSKPLPSQGSCWTNEFGLPFLFARLQMQAATVPSVPHFLRLSAAEADMKVLAIETVTGQHIPPGRRV